MIESQTQTVFVRGQKVSSENSETLLNYRHTDFTRPSDNITVAVWTFVYPHVQHFLGIIHNKLGHMRVPQSSGCSLHNRQNFKKHMQHIPL